MHPIHRAIFFWVQQVILFPVEVLCNHRDRSLRRGQNGVYGAASAMLTEVRIAAGAPRTIGERTAARSGGLVATGKATLEADASFRIHLETQQA